MALLGLRPTISDLNVHIFEFLQMRLSLPLFTVHSCHFVPALEPRLVVLVSGLVFYMLWRFFGRFMGLVKLFRVDFDSFTLEVRTGTIGSGERAIIIHINNLQLPWTWQRWFAPIKAYNMVSIRWPLRQLCVIDPAFRLVMLFLQNAIVVLLKSLERRFWIEVFHC